MLLSSSGCWLPAFGNSGSTSGQTEHVSLYTFPWCSNFCADNSPRQDRAQCGDTTPRGLFFQLFSTKWEFSTLAVGDCACDCKFSEPCGSFGNFGIIEKLREKLIVLKVRAAAMSRRGWHLASPPHPVLHHIQCRWDLLGQRLHEKARAGSGDTVLPQDDSEVGNSVCLS